MAAKLLHSLADDNPDLQKQIGCMTGIFQLFDRHHVVTGRRLTHKRLPPGPSHFQNGCLEGEFNNVRQTTTEINLNRNVNERQRSSTESSRASFASSCSSSSVERGKTAQREASSCDRFPETPLYDQVMTQRNTLPHLGRHSLDLRDVVKDSMYREARGLSLKTTANNEATVRSLKHQDSPRLVQLPKSADGCYDVGISGNQNVPADIKESLRVLAKLRDTPWYCNEARELSTLQNEVKDGSWHSMSRDGPRFSYDGKERNRSSFESRESIKSTPKLKEVPRLSLDSREFSMRGSNADSKPNYTFKKILDNGSIDNEVLNLPQSLGTQKRPPSVVAKLMGLDTLPESSSASDIQLDLIKTRPLEEKVPFSRSLKSNDLNKQLRVSNSPRRSLKDHTSPHWRNLDLIMKPTPNSKFPIEPAPWKQTEGSRGSQKTVSRPIKVPAKAQNSFPSIYSEIEKRLKDIEFKQSGKDLRALKQILEAMQAKGLIESSKEEQASSFGTMKASEPKASSPNPKLRSQRNLPNSNVIASATKDSDSLRTFESPIVIMKPAKSVQKSNISASSVIPIDSLSHKLKGRGFEDSKTGSVSTWTSKDHSPRSIRIDSDLGTSDKKTTVRNIRSRQSSTKPQQLPKQNTTNSAKSSDSVSPRLQERKLELDKRSRPSTPQSDVNKPRRQSIRHLTDSGSPGGKVKHKSQPNDDQLNQISNESRTLSDHGDDASVHSDSNHVVDSRLDMELTSSEHSIEFNGSQSPSLKAAKCLVSGSLQKKSILRLSEDEGFTELGMVTLEHPSPVSVIDASALRDDAPSPVKQASDVLKGDIAPNSNDTFSEDQWNPADKVLSTSMSLSLTSEISWKKLQNIDHLVQKLRRLNSSHDEARTDYIASLSENTTPDHRYISEMLLASGLLLRDLGSSLTTFQLHPSGHPINPELFFVLEQTNANTLRSREEITHIKVSSSKTDPEKIHRKLIFDAVNEILVKKLGSLGNSQEPWSRISNLAPKTHSAQKLLKELCSEIEHLQAKKSECNLEDENDDLKTILWEDATHRSGSWTDFNDDVSVVVLDVERLLFKDLVNETVIGEAGNLRAKPGRRRQLFSK